MKRATKKLALQRETIVALQRDELGMIAGGVSTSATTATVSIATRVLCPTIPDVTRTITTTVLSVASAASAAAGGGK